MGKKDARIDAYIADSAEFARPILKHLRALVHQGCPEVEETLKWRMPSFTYKGLLCGMAAFKQHATFGFWKHKLVVGEDAENDAMGQFGRITSMKDLPPDRALVAFVRKAAALNDAGVKVPSRARPKPGAKPELKAPAFLLSALEKDAKALRNWENFSPSCRKEYIEWLTEAKREETRARRLLTAMAWIAEDKGRNWKYERC
jgi:hypothetical protein